MRSHLETEHKLIACGTDLDVDRGLKMPTQIGNTYIATLILPNKDIVVIKVLRHATGILITITSFMTQLYDIRIRCYNDYNYICQWIEGQEIETKFPHSIWKDCFGQDKLNLSLDAFIRLPSTDID